MKKEDISEALNDVDFDMVEEAYEKAEKKKKNPWLKWGALAASLVLIIGAAIALPMLLQDNLPDVPLWDASHFMVNKLFSSGDTLGSGGTSAYIEVYTSENNPLKLFPTPWGRYLRIYERTDVTAEPNKAELQTLADAVIPKLADAFGYPTPEYSIDGPSNTGDYHLLKDIRSYRVTIDQYPQETNLKILNYTDDAQMVLDGNTVQVDRSLSNKEILASLRPIKKSLFKILGVSFSDVEIERGRGITIYFYNKDDHYLNKFYNVYGPDYLVIHFMANTTSGDILTNVSIRYRKLRVDMDELYPLVGKAEKLSLSDAEELLKKGYVFGGSSCLCAAPKKEIVFDSYDFVSFEYYSTNKFSADGVTQAIPVYAFYKELRTDHDGAIIYAKAYVPAIEIEGYEEYFETHKGQHYTN